MAIDQAKLARLQEISDRNLQDELGPAKRAIFDELIKRGLITVQQPVQQDTVQPQAGQPLNNIDVPTDTNLEQQSMAGTQPEASFAEKNIGTAEALGALATGATFGALGYMGGSLVGAAGELLGLTEEGEKIASEAARALTFEPKTRYGAELIADFAEIASALPPVMGAAPFQFARVGAIPTAKALKKASEATRAGRRTFQSLSKTKKALAEEIKAGNVNTGNIAKALDADGTLITNPKTKTALGLFDNDEAAYQASINFEYMNPSTKSNVSKMLDIIEDNYRSGDPLKIMVNRPAKVVGESLANRALKLDKIKKSASKSIGDLVNGEFGEVSIGTQKPLIKFISDLEDAGIPIIEKNGKLSVDTSESILSLGDVLSESKVNIVLNKLSKGSIKGKEAHRLKRQLNEAVGFDSGAVGGVKASKEIENAVNGLSSNLNESMKSTSAKYRAANERFSSVIDELKKADKMLGNQLMIGDELASSKFGSLAKRIGTNLASKEQVFDLIDSLDDAIARNVPAKYRPKDDIRRQVAALADLEKIFKVESAQAPFGFQSRIEQGVTGGLGNTGLAVEAGKFVLDKFREMSKKDFNDKIKATRTLLRESRNREQN